MRRVDVEALDLIGKGVRARGRRVTSTYIVEGVLKSIDEHGVVIQVKPPRMEGGAWFSGSEYINFSHLNSLKQATIAYKMEGKAD